MAQKITVETLDDLTGDEGASPREFSLDGTAYEIDLTEWSHGALKDRLADFVAAARKVSGRTSRTAKSATGRGSRGPATVDTAQTKAVRQWAQAHPDIVGFTVAERGRLPESVLALYNTHAGRSPAPVPVG